MLKIGNLSFSTTGINTNCHLYNKNGDELKSSDDEYSCSISNYIITSEEYYIKLSG